KLLKSDTQRIDRNIVDPWSPSYPYGSSGRPQVKTTSLNEQGSVYVRFLDKETEFADTAEALEFAEGVSAEFPGEPAVFVIDEEGVVTEDTFVNGRRMGETVEKFGFRADK